MFSQYSDNNIIPKPDLKSLRVYNGKVNLNECLVGAAQVLDSETSDQNWATGKSRCTPKTNALFCLFKFFSNKKIYTHSKKTVGLMG